MMKGVRKQRKIWAPHYSFSSQPSIHTSNSRIECVSILRSEVKRSELILCNFYIVLVRMKHLCLYELQNMTCVISVIPHRNEMLLHLHLKVLLHNVSVSSKIHANNVGF